MRRDSVIKALIILLALPALLLPAAVLGYVIWRGAPALSLEFVFTASEGQGFGIGGGILSQLIGSLLLALGGCLLAAPVALGAALYYHLQAGRGQRAGLEAILHMLQGIPPIVFGLAGLVVFVYLLNWGVSLASGAMVLAMVVLPLMTITVIDAIGRLPGEHTEAARALGLSASEIVGRVWLPQAWPGMLTGLLLAMARALSETAPILFTATVFSGVHWPDSIFSPVTSLQTHIFYLAQEGNSPQASAAAWGGAAVLVGVVVFFGLVAQVLKKMGEKRREPG